MTLTDRALQRPVTVVIAVISIAICAVLALTQMKVDIFPSLNMPVIYVAQPYGGMSPTQMEGYLVNYYEYHFLYITGIEHVESKSIQNVGLIKLVFHPGTDMHQALAQTISYVERSHAFMPPGTVSPFVMRFDAGSVPVGYLVFSSQSRSVNEVQDLALFRVRPTFATLPGVSSPPPFGGNQRTVVVRVDPELLRSHHMSPDEVVQALAKGNTIIPSGNVRIGYTNRLTSLNSVVSDIHELLDLPLRTGSGPTVFLKDIGVVEDAGDIIAGYALVNSKRTVYIPVTKRADASTVAVVDRVKAELPRFQSLVPPDVKISFEFDQSTYVKNAIFSLCLEVALGTLLTGLMVFIFLRDFKSAAIVTLTIPFALLTATVALWLSSNTINIMTLGGLALAVGILVDEATVTVENIHTHLEHGQTISIAALEASKETLVPRFLAMLSVIAVFVPSLFMVGTTRALFVPLSLAVGYSMLASYLLSSTLVPILSVLLLKREKIEIRMQNFLRRIQSQYKDMLSKILQRPWLFMWLYIGTVVLLLLLCIPLLGKELFPTTESRQFQIRLRAPTGTRVEHTELLALKALDLIAKEVGKSNLDMSLCFVGTQPASYPINTIFLWTSGPHEAVLLISLRPDSGLTLPQVKEKLRRRLAESLPDVEIIFEPGDIITEITNFGAPTPIEVAIRGPNYDTDKQYAAKLLNNLKSVKSLRDLQYGQAQDYPTVDIKIDRKRCGQLGVTVDDIGKSLLAATSSSRFMVPNYWADPSTGVGYQLQVEIPQHLVSSIDAVKAIPAMVNGQAHPLLSDVAEISYGKVPGEIDRYNMQRLVTITANLSGEDLWRAARDTEKVIEQSGKKPRGVTVEIRGQVPIMKSTLSSLLVGLCIAILVIFLLLAGYFQSLRLAIIVFATIPAIICGAAIALLCTAMTINVQSFIGAIMAIGVGVSNTILLITFCEKERLSGHKAATAAVLGSESRLRPILMTTIAMIAGMLPMALGFGENGNQTAPLARAVIGGLLGSTLTVLLILPAMFALMQKNATRNSVSLHPYIKDDNIQTEGQKHQ